MGPTLRELAQDLAAGRTTARTLVEECLERIEAPAGQGPVAFLSVDREGALAAADAMDALRRTGVEPSPLAGIPIAIKDLFDVRGQVTGAGSTVLAGEPAAEDAPAVARLRRAGFVLIGRTNMTEFAFSGLGLNPHFGTPLSPWRREEKRIAGGSTSGGAVSVADGMAHAALGTDTGGSCRIPAAWCRLVGFKPTASRIPRDGAVPLSKTLDSIGPVARSVECCALLDALLAGDEAEAPPPRDIGSLRLGAVDNLVLDGIDPEIAAVYSRALDRLASAGAAIERIAIPAFDRVADASAKGGFPASEAYAWHRDLLARRGDDYDPRVAVRIRRGAAMDAADYIDLVEARAAIVADAALVVRRFDAVLMPTVPIAPPELAPLEASDEEFARVNLLALRNPTLINMIDGCAISMPMAGGDAPPAGLMLASVAGRDRALLAVAAAAEAALAA